MVAADPRPFGVCQDHQNLAPDPGEGGDMRVIGIDSLLALAGRALGPAFIPTPAIPEVVRPLLRARNGFYAFGGALHVLPSAADEPSVMSAPAWNEISLWKFEYPNELGGLFCFAEDVFGGQYGVRDERFFYMDPETGEVEPVADDLGAWADEMVSQREFRTGEPIAREWLQERGQIPPGQRLVPRTPFVTGGAYALINLVAVDAVAAMRARGNVARQIRDLPDGAKVRLVVEEHEPSAKPPPIKGPVT